VSVIYGKIDILETLQNAKKARVDMFTNLFVWVRFYRQRQSKTVLEAFIYTISRFFDGMWDTDSA